MSSNGSANKNNNNNPFFEGWANNDDGKTANGHNNNNINIADEDDSKTLITANELLEKSQASQVSYQQRYGLDEDSATLVHDDADESVIEEVIEGPSGHKLNRQNTFKKLDAHLQQLRYNDIKLALDRSINTAVDILENLKAENGTRPMYYPADLNSSTASKLNSAKSRIALIRKNTLNNSNKALLKRADSLNMDDDNGTLSGGEAKSLNILNLNLRIDQSHDDLISNLDKESLATLLDGKIISTKRHLLSLKDRIDDTSSKVFVTGDLNAGKSAFCNALLRRKLLPEDEQPCTNVFCEIIDATENNNVEEVHAVPIGSHYNKKNQSTYQKFAFDQLDNLVYESDKYAILKVYCNDNRPREQSLLKNDVIDIRLVDAPGLNMDSYQTTEVFSRQEEIDLVVFVVDARNHFTLSGKEFISATANEKNLIFIVVNKFDTVKNKEKCQNRILDQVANLSPDTHKDSKEFVHFISSDQVLSEIPGDDGDGGGDDDNDNDNDPYRQDNPDFDRLEASLRRFVLEKRALSKLLPARNYTINVLKDLEYLFEVNEAMYTKDKEQMLQELDSLTPQYEETLQQSVRVHEKINKFIENACNDVYNYSKERINSTIFEINEAVLVPDSTLDIYSYARALQQAMIDKIVEAVNSSESYARAKTSEKVEIIKQIGSQEAGPDFYSNRVFRDELMFTKRRDSFQKKLNDDISPLDFFDPSIENAWKIIETYCGLPIEGVTHAISTLVDPSFLNLGKGAKAQIWKGSASAVACVSSARYVTQFVSPSDLFSVRFVMRFSKPIIFFGAIAGAAYLILDMPHAFQRKTARKISRQIAELDYQHKNSNRIAKEVRTVLNYPARDVLNSLQTNIDKTAARRDKVVTQLQSSDLSSAFYSKNLKVVVSQIKLINELELESLNRVD